MDLDSIGKILFWFLCLCFSDLILTSVCRLLFSVVTEVMNEIRPSVYRAATKLMSLQKLCHMDNVLVRHVQAALRTVGGAKYKDIMMDREEVTVVMDRMFHAVSQDVPGHETSACPEETIQLVFRLCDGSRTGNVSCGFLRVALVSLSSDELLLKYRGLVSGSGSFSRSGLRSLLQDLSQVPAVVQEEAVFGGVEAAVRSCFNGVLSPMVSEEHVVSWMQTEPRLLLWLPTLYRLSAGQNIKHNVRCYTCNTSPITGLRYRCMKCVNVHVCQSCFLTHRQSRKHKPHHPVLEFCTQPTWKESLSSLVHSARHALLPRRHTHRDVDRSLVMWAEPGETQNSAPPPSDASTRLVESAHSPSSDRSISHDAVRHPSLPCTSSSKALQTDEDTPSPQASTLLTDVRNLQRDKWLLEQEVQAWRLTVQSEHGVLEDRCSEMEVTVESLRQHNVHLQDMLTQALNKMEAQQHTKNMWSGDMTAASDTTEEEEEEEEEERQTASLTVLQVPPLSHDRPSEDESSDDGCPIGRQVGPEEVDLQGEVTCLPEEEEEDCGTCSPEELLQETVERLRTVMKKDTWTERRTGEGKRTELLKASDQVGQSIHHLVDTVRTN
ncbi:dystrotelin isoform X2 [Mugil cephalus]|nr:dystrotelin isoform X2 [Mugil cephalus]